MMEDFKNMVDAELLSVQGGLRREDMTILVNRKLSCWLTRMLRVNFCHNNLIVKIPWEDEESPKTGLEWNRADVISCGDKPKTVGTIDFRIVGYGVEIQNVKMTNCNAITGQRKRGYR